MKSIRTYVSIILSILIMIVIFKFSNQQGDISYGISYKVTNLLESLKISEHIPLINNSLSYTVRKIAHITLYFILGILISSSTIFIMKLKKTQIKGYTIFLISSIVCFVYACLDEFHQTFIDGRTGKFSDVGVDAIGFITSILIVISIYKIVTIFNKKQ